MVYLVEWKAKQITEFTRRLCCWLIVVLLTSAATGQTVPDPTPTPTPGKALVAHDPRFPVPTRATKEEPEKPYNVFWQVDPQKSITRIEVWIQNQILLAYQGDCAVALIEVSTGMHDYETPMGHYKIQVKEREHFSSQYGEIINNASGKVVDWNAYPYSKVPKGCRYQPSPMPYFMRLTDKGVGFHTGYLPGYAASHGCIRLHDEDAKKLFEVTPVGTPVQVTD
jgi:lipoprotein-anchoring transpeptidase ErfK/SrfK